MPFPFSARATVEVRKPSCDVEPTLLRLADFLKQERASEIRRDGDTLAFASGWDQLTASRWNPLAAISSGTLRVRENGVTLALDYEIRFTRMLLVVTAVVICFFGPVFFEDHDMAACDKAATMVAMWTALFGGNYIVCIVGFPALLQSAATGRDPAPLAMLEGACRDGTVHH
jgi:hypothetical protein